MTLCPIALAVHCTRCPLVKVCPAKRALGDFGTYVPAGAKPDRDAPTQKIDRAQWGLGSEPAARSVDDIMERFHAPRQATPQLRRPWRGAPSGWCRTLH